MNSSFNFLQMWIKYLISNGKVKKLGFVRINMSLQSWWKWGAVIFYRYFGGCPNQPLVGVLSNSPQYIKVGAEAERHNKVYMSRLAISLNPCWLTAEKESLASSSNWGYVNGQGKGTASKCYKGQIGKCHPFSSSCLMEIVEVGVDKKKAD